MTDLALRIRRAAGTRAARENTSKKRSLRADVQGLRAFAVIVVILDHLIHWPSGGFIGVDIFFVISGFVITESLLREQERTGSISFSGFYKRRIKRILPASTLVLLVTVAASFLLLNQSRFVSVVWDAVWAMFFSGNWHFASVGTDYFQAAGPVSPLQHYWSLAVEEQFYFVWPWVMLLIFSLMSRRSATGTAQRVAVGAAITAICAASFVWAINETAASPTVAYFSTFSRAWELGIGALIGVVSPVLVRIPRAARPLLAWLGVMGMVVSLFVVSGDKLFPAPMAALPVLSAALFIIAGTGASEQRFLAPFTNPVSGYLGDISYSLYLWHFPVIVIVAAFMEESLAYYLIAGLGGLAVAIYAYHLVEDPIRKSSWLNGAKSKRSQRQPFKDSYKLTALSMLAVVTFAVVGAALVPPRQPAAATDALPKPSASASGAPHSALSPAVQDVQKAVSLSLNGATWPENLDPTLDQPGQGIAREMGAGCLNPTNGADTQSCTSGSGPKLAMVIGDSVAASWAPAVRNALNNDGYSMHTVAFSDCAFVQSELEISNKPDITRKCNAARPLIAQQITELKPDIVFISSSESDFNYLKSGKRGPDAVAEWSAGIAASIKIAQGVGSKVVVLASNPQGKSVATCATKTSSPADCADLVSSQWFLKAEAEKKAATETGATFIDPRSWMCSANDVCPMHIRGKLVRWDSVHLTEPFSGTVLAPLLRETIASLIAS
ncbi:acyltransferase family protein [Pseudarthrobacter sp. NIBRBAC000502770]|uniref:acyltransferase family protein n=1 Tax=Pseudarthrobacter sp. NIBRBAC000502770 TaxID=2590785 RepID=UPI0011401186|nr:acyltransferase family protein [Pseudarthrobacter sp. NIBRBAC000502770]QDG88880.1 acyltransferase [Pseudarthrobacter sp. NIBRBAC000502770]